jgi:hypothetical protein
MKTEDVLLIAVIAGFGLTCCYLVSEVLSWQTLKAADTRALLGVRQLYKRLHSATKPLLTRAIHRKR